MAYPPVYAQEQKGTLVPGQVIAVNKYNVQVERFLSQGGFAHVYLVRTAEPVFNTTHHVLKRIAVADEAMLNDVKKEVDIMRILRGHPNIVYLIDAAWHRMPSGMFEVFILMEFCSGGGIIDMMNRRLRERLTESEILQIFVDVCEGVAAMHNLRPSLLHRDLKVENILQASATSYKLCDFGSAMPVATRPPSTTQEMRALEADLNKHTTLQYRAPEMVDVFLRRPVDERSDVWALGVLLYKLCYHTTPFEEHGILAILNVQYKFPPYPIYSQQLNALIASMLQEHGAHRPSVFEILDTVHQMRGTKSRFTYTPPPRQPLSPRKPSLPSLNKNEVSPSANSSGSAASPGPAMNGIQAREKVLEAIAPMRRGRPSSPTKGPRATDEALALVDAAGSGAWSVKPAKAYKSGLASSSTARSSGSPVGSGLGDAWEIPGMKNDKKQLSDPSTGFGDAFDASSTSISVQSVPVLVPRPSPARTGSSLRPPGDAFDSLSVFPSPRTQAPTLGEVQKAGLAVPRPSPSPQLSSYKYSSPSPSIKSPSPVPTGVSPIPRRDASPLLRPRASDQALPAEQRFPTLEELNAGTFGSSFAQSPGPSPSGGPSPPQLPPRPEARQGSSEPTTASFYPASVTGALRPSAGLGSSLTSGPRNDGVRSQHVTGTVMRDARKMASHVYSMGSSSSLADKAKAEQTTPRNQRIETKSREKLDHYSKPMLTRKHRSSVSFKHTQRSGSDAVNSPSSPKPVTPLPAEPPKDWLTGANDEDDAITFDNSAVLRASPEKRTSVLHSPVPPNVEQEAVRATSPVKRKPVPVHRPGPIEVKESVSSGLTDNWSPVPADLKSSSSSDEGPEDAAGFVRPSKGPLKDLNEPARQRSGHKTRQGSVHDLVDLWGGSASMQFQNPSATRHEKRSSVFAPKPAASKALPEQTKKLTLPLVPSSTNSASTAADVPPPTRSAIIVSRKPSLDARHPPPNHSRQALSPAKRQPLPSSPSKSRPQSMLILPIQKSVSENTAAPSPVQAALSPPPDRARTAHRRSSISDIVSRYEAIGVQGMPVTTAVAPPTASKPTRLCVVSPPSVASPTAAGARLPRISPTSTPVTPAKAGFGTSLDLPASSPTRGESRRAASPSPSSRPVSPAFQSSSSLALKEREPTNPGFRSSTPVRTHASPLLSKGKELAPVQPVSELQERFERKQFNAPSAVSPAPAKADQSEDARASSPERPYQGVSKLIDQWQKKTEGPDVASRSASAGFKGPGSRFKREGIAAGGGKGV
ncbi:hypothetical protein M0805_005848 [Coniferiporia weirii]|nr:hypothetical protein M0805_005848 [Coniferiporia weirii]